MAAQEQAAASKRPGQTQTAKDVCAPACLGGAEQWLTSSHATFLLA